MGKRFFNCLIPQSAHPELTELARRDGIAAARRLSEMALQEISKLPGFLESRPILIGSWGRGELCPQSDLDLIFTGPEMQIRRLLQHTEAIGLQLRYRAAEIDDLLKDMPLFDQLSFLSAVPVWGVISSSEKDQISQQKQALLKRLRASFKLKTAWKAELIADRAARCLKYSAYKLEVHLKLGQGGLRDLFQLQTLLDLYGLDQEFLKKARHCLLQTRFQLGLLHPTAEFLAAPEQEEIAQAFYCQKDFSGPIHFMKEVLLSLREIDRALELSLASDLTSPKIRTGLTKKLTPKAHGGFSPNSLKELSRFILTKKAEAMWVKKYKEGFFTQALPYWSQIEGRVQHDVFHVYCTDYHIFQVFLWCLRAEKKPRLLQSLFPWAAAFEEKDWLILKWVCFFHDLAKGYKNKKGDTLDHAVQGNKWVRRHLPEPRLREEVGFLVRHHLLLSELSFKKVPADSELVRLQKSLNLNTSRVRRLAVFTALDILGTREEAWNAWKAQLLFQTAQKLQDQELAKKSHLSRSLGFLSAEGFPASGSFAESDQSPFFEELVSLLGASVIEKDLRAIYRSGEPLSFKVYPFRGGKRLGLLWVRFHSRNDKAGVLLDALRALKAVGLSVQQSFVFSSGQVGVYDWFLVSKKRTQTKILEKRLQQAFSESWPELVSEWSHRVPHTRPQIASQRPPLKAPQKALWKSGEVSEMEKGAILFQMVLRGEDRPGLLVATCDIFLQLGVEVLSARIQTWGKLAEDVFVLRSPVSPYASRAEWWQKNRHHFIGPD